MSLDLQSNLFLIVLGVLTVFLAFVIAIMNNRSYRNKARIARQTGENIDDVIWIEEKFKVVYKDGYWKIKFKNLRETTNSLPGRFWTKFIKPGKMKKILQYNVEEWKTKDMSKLIQRGLILYESNEGEFFPVSITKGEGIRLTVLDQDNRQFIIDETMNVNKLVRQRGKEFTVLLAAIIGCVVIGAIFLGGTWFINKQNQASIAESARICANLLNPVTTNGTSRPGFISDLATKVGG